MSAHRFRALMDSISPAPVATTAVPCGFVPCPCAVMGAFTPAHQQFVQEVYRIARERTESQLQPRRIRLPEPSLN